MSTGLDHRPRLKQRHSITERMDDLYETPRVAVEALLRVEQLPCQIWEPACGPGAISEVLRKAGHDVWSTDLVDYGYEHALSRVDFLLEHRPTKRAIITNPPFKLAERFVGHALELSPLVIMLLRLAFIEGQRRAGILEARGLRSIYVFSRRLPMMHRAGWAGPRTMNSGMAFAWYVWDRSYRGDTTIKRISWEG